MKEDQCLVMTHGELHPRNVMAAWEKTSGELEQTIRVTSVINWDPSWLASRVLGIRENIEHDWTSQSARGLVRVSSH